jgi:hypothetical protein
MLDPLRSAKTGAIRARQLYRINTLCQHVCMKRLTATVLLIPAIATATPHACKIEHVAIQGQAAACSGVLMPATTALAGARCIDARLPTCQALRRRDAHAARRRVVMLADELAQAKRWRDIALTPAPIAAPRVVVRRVGLPGWAVGAIAGACLLLGGWAGWRVAR